MNLAQLWKLPVIFVCENNGYNEYTHFSEIDGRRRSRARAAAFGIADRDGRRPERPRRLRGGRRSTSSARAQGDGPAFLQCNTYRYHGHHVGDIARAYYRPKAEEQEWVDASAIPVTLHGEWLMAERRGRSRRARRDPGGADRRNGRRAWSSPSNAPYPDPSKVDQDIYA